VPFRHDRRNRARSRASSTDAPIDRANPSRMAGPGTLDSERDRMSGRPPHIMRSAAIAAPDKGRYRAPQSPSTTHRSTHRSTPRTTLPGPASGTQICTHRVSIGRPLTTSRRGEPNCSPPPVWGGGTVRPQDRADGQSASVTAETRPTVFALVVVDRSTIRWTEQHGTDSLKNGGACQRTRQHVLDGILNLAKVRVAGSNPVVRSRSAPVFGGGGVACLPIMPIRLPITGTVPATIGHAWITPSTLTRLF
jgi:hypothetical protein